jgi:hypothetical protein
MRMITLNSAHKHTHTHTEARTVLLRDLDLGILNTDKRQTDMQLSSAGYEPEILVSNFFLFGHSSNQG